MYSDKEKQTIMIFGDLIDNSLEQKEKVKVKTSKLDFNSSITEEALKVQLLDRKLANKILNLLNQSFSFGIELEKLSNRGVNISSYYDLMLEETIKKKFEYTPELVFHVGNTDILSDENKKIVTDFKAFKKYISNNSVLFLSDRPMKDLLTDSLVAESLKIGRLIIVSDNYNSGASINIGRVFISGSRSIESLNDSIKNTIDTICSQKISILLGDSEKGIDKEIIEHLRSLGPYPKVSVYSISSKPRIKLDDSWMNYMVSHSSLGSSQEKQMVKDRKMADLADWGLAIFMPLTKNRFGSLQVSSGTLRNTIQMLLQNKPVKFFYLYEGKMRVKSLKSMFDLESVLSEYKNENIDDLEYNNISTSKGVDLSKTVSLVKFEKIEQKYKSLLKNEKMLTKGKEGISNTKEKQLSLF